jgi:hypothetical protein
MLLLRALAAFFALPVLGDRNRGALSCLQLFGMKDLHTWRPSNNLAEVAHPVICVFGYTGASVAKPIELIKVRQLDFELQSWAASVATG